MYRLLTAFLLRFIPRPTLFKYGFNLSPMYRRSTGRIRSVSDDLHSVELEIPLTWRNVNYVGTMFGGSMLSATDPIYMVQLIQILGEEYVVWDRSVQMRLLRPARSRLCVRFEYTEEELRSLRERVAAEGEVNIDKPVVLVDRDHKEVASGMKTLYVASKNFYRNKRRAKSSGEADL